MDQGVRNHVGQRLSFNYSRCTVRYVGTVIGTSGNWLGVEWDDPTSGKHSGVHNGVQYFKCKSPSHHAASFIRPYRPSDIPVSFLQALKDKYQDSSAEEENDIVVIGGKIAEAVGFDKIKTAQAKLQSLEVVLLDNRQVAGPQRNPWAPEISLDDIDQASIEIGRTCPRIRQLDLSYNLVESLVEVAAVCRRLLDLRILTLNGNRFRSLSIQGPLFEQFDCAFHGVTELSLNETLLSWDEVIGIISLFPNVRALSLAANNICTLQAPIPCLSLESINLAHNNIPSFESLESLSVLPRLKSLCLHDNSIETLSSKTVFCNLVSLDISANSFSNLASLSLINTLFPSVSSLRVSYNPFYRELSADAVHMLLIARIPKVSVLNFCQISYKERDDAELYYLSQVATELGSSDETESAKVLQRHPLWASLCQKHGAPAIYRAKPGDAKQGSLRTRLVRLGIRTGASPKDDSVQWIFVPKSINLYMLKSIIGDYLGLLPSRFHIKWETSEWDLAGSQRLNEEHDGRFELNSLLLGDVHKEGSWIQREVDFVTGTSSLGFWIEDNEAQLRIERTI